MGARTETSIRIDRLSKTQLEKVLDKVVNSAKKLPTYRMHTEQGFDVGFKNFCNFVMPRYELRQMTEVDFVNEYVKYVSNCDKMIVDAGLVLNGEMSFMSYCIQNDLLRRYGLHLSVIKHNDNYYVNTEEEIFDNSEYDCLNINLDTVDALIDHLKNPALTAIRDLSVPGSKAGPLTPELEQKIRDYYNKIGDHNFIVNFG